MTPTDFRAAFDVFVKDGQAACFDFIVDQGFTKSFANRVVDGFDRIVTDFTV